MRVITCLFVEHNLWLVALAAMVCVSGCWVTFRLFQRSAITSGLQRLGWIFQTGVAAGASVWCTHFVAMLAYDANTGVEFDPVLTALSLVIAIAGLGFGFGIAATHKSYTPEIGGAVVGLAIPAMHYTGMAAYHVDGIVEWDAAYVIASLAASVAISVVAVSVAARKLVPHSIYAGAGILVLAIVSLHFTAMAAVSVTPLASNADDMNPAIFVTMAMAVAGVSLFILGTGVASYLIDSQSRTENILRLQQLAHYDTLTGLPNRASFTERLDSN